MRRARGLDGLARELGGLAPSCGPVRLVAVDGHAGSGKTTFSGRLAAALGGAPVLHTDDMASHEALFDWTERVRAEVTGPLSRGAAARFRIYDWRQRDFTRAGEIPPRPVVLVEGAGAGRQALRPLLAALLWMDLPHTVAWRRGMCRDGPEQAGFWERWKQAELRHFAADPSRPHANFLVRERGTGFEVLEGPA